MVRFVRPVKAAVQHALLKSTVYDQVLTGGKVGLKRAIDAGQLLPCSLCRCDFLLLDEKPKIGKCELRRELLVQSDQMVPDVFRGGYFLFGNKQTKKRQVQIRSSRQRPIKNRIRVSGCAPAELESRVDRIRIVCENNAKTTECPFLITLDQEKVRGLPGDVRCRRVRFHSPFNTPFLLAGSASHLISAR